MSSITLRLEPFPVPTSVTINMPQPINRDVFNHDSIKPTLTISLTQLSDEELGSLIDEFAENVMKAARPEWLGGSR